MPTHFKNLATRESEKPAKRAEAVAEMLNELSDCGIAATVFDMDMCNSEVPGFVVGGLSGWCFTRAWRYWIAKGPGLPVEVAERLHATHGEEVRVDGHCGCPSPRYWFKGFGVGHYHIDTREGLKALAETILSVYDPSKDPEAMPRMGGKLK